MRNPILINISILALFNFCSCSSIEILNKETFIEEYKNSNKYYWKSIKVNMKDNLQYNFNAGNYYFDVDSLAGKGIVNNKKEVSEFEGKIAIDDISSIEYKSVDVLATIGLFTGVLIIGTLISLIIIAMDFSSTQK